MMRKKTKEMNMKLEKFNFNQVYLLFVVFAFSFSNELCAQVPSKEIKVLMEFYTVMDGENWTQKWDLDEPLTKWHGVKVNDGHVVELNLFGNNLKGHIPKSIGKLENLKALNLAFNNISGELPSSIAELNNLKVLKVEMNMLRGELPFEIGNLKNLEELTAFNNFISGTIPESLGNIDGLKTLNLSSNRLDGGIPESIGNLTNLVSLGLFENSLKGIIPRQMGNMTELKELVLANNDLYGEIPTEIGQLASLEVFQIQNNKFDSFKNLEQMDARQFLVFDYDKESFNNDFKDIKFSKTRMADTKFDDEENE